MYNVHQIEHRYLIASLVVLLFAVSTLTGRRTIITPFRYVAIVVSAAVAGMYGGQLSVLLGLHW
jgi:ABC-type transporter Mla subunit MlaD